MRIELPANRLHDGGGIGASAPDSLVGLLAEVAGKDDEASAGVDGGRTQGVVDQPGHVAIGHFGEAGQHNAAAGVGDEEVAYLGDDLPDVPLIDRVGLGVAVANGRAEVKERADYITTACGGSGAIREVVELIMKAKGTWGAVLARYVGTG